MRQGLLSDYFEGVGFKKLTAVEVSPDASNQHEFAGGHLKALFGEGDRKNISARFIWLNDEQEGVSDIGFVTFYDARRKHPTRSEYRLYYEGNSTTALMEAGDTFFVALRSDRSVVIAITPGGSTIERQLAWMFGLDDAPELGFEVRQLTTGNSVQMDFAARYVMDEIGVNLDEPQAEKLDEILARERRRVSVPGNLAKIARESLPEIDPNDDADKVLIAWLEREEALFKRLERQIVSDQLRGGFVDSIYPDAGSFSAFSVSVQRRRKSRGGHSLEDHVEALLRARNLKFERGVIVEGKGGPDFLFPGRNEYFDPGFSSQNLTMLSSRYPLSDGWREVLDEASRISQKHLVTLEPSISEFQTDAMKALKLQLVIPRALHATYKQRQKEWLMDMRQFIELVHGRQGGH